MPKQADVLSQFRRGNVLENVPEISLPSAPVMGRISPPTTPTSVDLSGKPKVWFLLGGGNVGKTVYARWLISRMIEQGRGAVLAALDPGVRALSAWFEDVHQPDGSDSARIERFTGELVEFLTENRQPGILDFGAAGEVALQSVAAGTGGLAGDMEAAGLGVVACYVMSPRHWDATILDRMDEVGFRPQATLIVLNEGKVDAVEDPSEKFAPILRHSAYKRAVDRGAVTLWLPALDSGVMDEIELKLIHFHMARDGLVPEGATFSPIGGLRRSRVSRWLERVEQAHGPVRSWLP